MLLVSAFFEFIEEKIKLWDIIVSNGGHKEDQASL